MSPAALQYEIQNDVAVLRLDDGKANALSPAVIAAANDALDRAERAARAILLVGRPGRFCAGFDLTVMRQGGEAVSALVTAGAELALRLYEGRLPVVAACTGHAVAMGALLLLASDLRIGAEGDFKIGLNEVGIRMTLPVFGVELARDRLSKRHLARATLAAELYGPSAAVDAGYLDHVTSAAALETEALSAATQLAGLDARAFAATKQRLRAASAARIRDSLAEDMRRLAEGT